MQYGLSMGNYNFCNFMIPLQLGVSKEDVSTRDFYNSIISTVVPLGATFGSLFGHSFAENG